MSMELSAEQGWSHRWETPMRGQRWVQVPWRFVRKYAELGISPVEAMLVLHLAAYRFEVPWGRSRPSLETIAGEMGCSRRQVRRLVRSLEERGFLQVTERVGRPSEYRFRGVSVALERAEAAAAAVATGEGEAVAGSVTPDTHVLPKYLREDTHVRGPRTPMSPEQEKQQEKHHGVGGDGAMERLVGVGMSEGEARRWAAAVDPERVEGWIRYAEGQGAKLWNVPGFLITKFRSGQAPPANGDGRQSGRRYMEGPYADYIQH